MKNFLKGLILVSLLGQVAMSGEYKTVVVKDAPQLEVTENTGIISIESKLTNEKKPAVSCAWRNIKPTDGQGNAISFDVKGDGSDFLASVFLGEHKSLLNDAHEATFTLSSTDWTTVSIPFTEFAANPKPWGVKKMDGSKLIPHMDKITHLGFGRGFHFHRYKHPSYSFQVRNIKFIELPEIKNYPIKQGIKTFKEKLAANQKVNILLLGDSITEMGKEQSHFVHAMNKMGKQATVANAAIGGHSVRGGQLVFSRSLKKMPKPDLVFMMYGANDCKALTETSGFSSEVFEKQVLSLINKVNRETQGQCEFLLVNGVPRVEKESFESKNIVEPLAPAYDRISQQYGLTLCDSLSQYLSLSVADKQRYYKDTIHQNQDGLKFLGSLIAKTIENCD